MQVLALVGGAGILAQLDVSPVLVLVTVGGVAALLRTLRRRRDRRDADRRCAQVLAACEALAADLAAGLAPVQALRAVAADVAELRPVAHAAEIGADVPTAFRAVATRPGAAMLRVAASAWSVSHRSGTGLAHTFRMAVDTMRSDRRTARVLATELAAALATARLLTVLPLGILLLGRGMGGDPFAFLVGSIPGQLCLSAGLGLAWCGYLWLERIADQIDSV